jgi:hypothetical protein
MNRDDIIRMAREAGGSSGGIWGFTVIELERFFKLAYEAGAAAERKRLREEIHSCHANCDHPVCVAVRKERKECANKVGEFARKWWSIHCASNKHLETTRKAHEDFCALQSAIRARGQE